MVDVVTDMDRRAKISDMMAKHAEEHPEVLKELIFVFAQMQRDAGSALLASRRLKLVFTFTV